MVLEVENLQVDFPQAQAPIQAVRGVSFGVDRGEVLGILGESGSGKSVSVGAALRLLGKDAQVRGRITFDGRDVYTLSSKELVDWRTSQVSMIFQEPNRAFDPIYSIGKTFEETLKLRNPKWTRAQLRAEAVRLMEEVQIQDAASRLVNFPHQFSGGMLQRIMIALALSGNPEILVADEPTTALDVTIQAQIVKLLLELQASRNMGMIFITHDLALLSNVAQRVVVMYGGLIVEEGPVGQVLGNPRSPYTRALLQSRPQGKSHTLGRIPSIPGVVPHPARPEPGCPFEPRCTLRTSLCRQKVPQMVQDSGSPVRYRCFIPGVKK